MGGDEFESPLKSGWKKMHHEISTNFWIVMGTLCVFVSFPFIVASRFEQL